MVNSNGEDVAQMVNHCTAYNDSYYLFLIFTVEKQNYCINFDTFKLKVHRRIIVATIPMFFMLLFFILLRGQRMVSEPFMNGQRIR